MTHNYTKPKRALLYDGPESLSPRKQNGCYPIYENHSRFGGICKLRETLNLERLKKIDVEFTHGIDTAALAVHLESAEVQFLPSSNLACRCSDAEFLRLKSDLLPISNNRNP